MEQNKSERMDVVQAFSMLVAAVLILVTVVMVVASLSGTSKYPWYACLAPLLVSFALWLVLTVLLWLVSLPARIVQAVRYRKPRRRLKHGKEERGKKTEKETCA